MDPEDPVIDTAEGADVAAEKPAEDDRIGAESDQDRDERREPDQLMSPDLGEDIFTPAKADA